jgi:uncharacterized HAD superfamily protein
MAMPVIAVDLDGVVAEFNGAFLEMCIEVIKKYSDREYHGSTLYRDAVYYRAANQTGQLSSGSNFAESIRQEFYTHHCAKWDNSTYIPKMWDWANIMFGQRITNAAWQLVDRTEFWLEREALQPWMQLVKNLSQDHIVYFITSRRATQACMEQTHEWLKQQGIEKPNVIFTKEGYKGWAVGAVGAKVFIDDYYKNCVDVLRIVGTTCKVIVKDTPYNRLARENGPESNYIHRVFTMEDFFNATQLDTRYQPEGSDEYGRNEKRLWESTVVLDPQRSPRRSRQSLPEWDGEVRQEQLEVGDGVEQISQRVRETLREMARRPGISDRLQSPPSGACHSEPVDVVTVNPVEGGNRRSAVIDSIGEFPAIGVPSRGFITESHRMYVRLTTTED